MSDALPRYELGEELGRGAWGVVVAARHRDLDREVAIKQLPRAFGADPDVRARFRREAQLLAALAHPHVVQIHDFVEHEGLCLLVMERLDGGTLTARFADQGMRREESVAATLAACEALQRAHDRDVLHRDVKPDNLMFTGDGTLKVTDFGIAKVLGGSQTVATQAGLVLGTPAYMAPEQASGEELGPGTDVYALAVILYELLSGRLPFPIRDNLGAMLRDRAFGEPIPLSEAAPDVPPDLVAAVERGLAREPEARIGSAREFGAQLAEAANRALGDGWLTRQPLEVVASGPIAASLAAARASTAPAATDSVAVRRSAEIPAAPEPAATPTPDEVVPVAEVLEEAPATPPPPPTTPPPTTPPPTTTSPPPATTLPPAPSTGGGRSRWPWVAGAGAVAAAAVVAGVLLLGGGDDAPEERSTDARDEPATTTTETPTTTTAEVAVDLEFAQVRDDSGTLVVEVPEDWTDVNGAPTTAGADLQVAPDLEDFLDEDHDAPGLELGALPTDVSLDVILDSFGDTIGADCQVEDEEPYQDPLYQGRMRTLDCPDGAEVVVVAAAPQDEAFHLGLVVEVPDGLDDEVMERVLATFQATGDPLAAATG